MSRLKKELHRRGLLRSQRKNRACPWEEKGELEWYLRTQYTTPGTCTGPGNTWTSYEEAPFMENHRVSPKNSRGDVGSEEEDLEGELLLVNTEA